MDRNDTKGAIIQLKNALQQDGKNLPALVLLGKAYLKAGQPLGADRVLADAERLGAARSEIIAMQVEVYHILGRNQDLLDRFSPDGLPPGVSYKVLVTRAYAQMDLGKDTEAIQSLEQARQIDPDNPAALVAQSLAQLRMNNFPAAQDLANLAISKSPADPAVWNMKASIAHAQGNLQDALAGYSKALTLQPDYLDALIARASLLLDLNRDSDAGRDIAVLTQKFSDDPRSAYLHALLAGRQGKTVEARNALICSSERIGCAALRGGARSSPADSVGRHFAFQPGAERKSQDLSGQLPQAISPSHGRAQGLYRNSAEGEGLCRGHRLPGGPGACRPQ